MSLPQVKLLIRACDKRDAESHLHLMQDFHTAIAPLMVGDDGKEVLEERKAMLKRIVEGTNEEKRKDQTFAKLLAIAQAAKPS